MVYASVILPTFNESMNIAEMIRQILLHLKNAEVIVVDDNSPDLTWKIVEDMKNPHVRVIRRIHEKGVGSAIYAGIRSAKGEIICWMDCDLTMPPSLLPAMIAQIGEYDVGVGSRYAPGGGDDRSFVRVITSRMINWLANLILDVKVLDYDSGFIVAKRKVLDNVPFNTAGHGEYCIEFLYKAGKRGYRIKEIGYVFREREKGESKTAKYLFNILIHGFKYVWRIIKIRFG